jgi:hypothetical protein
LLLIDEAAVICMSLMPCDECPCHACVVTNWSQNHRDGLVGGRLRYNAEQNSGALVYT